MTNSGEPGAPSVQTKNRETLPKTLPGVICPQWIRCGRRSCRCARGRVHGPYYYRFWREGGRLKKVYVKRSDLEEVRAQCVAHRQERRRVAASLQLWRQMAALLREVDER